MSKQAQLSAPGELWDRKSTRLVFWAKAARNLGKMLMMCTRSAYDRDTFSHGSRAMTFSLYACLFSMGISPKHNPALRTLDLNVWLRSRLRELLDRPASALFGGRLTSTLPFRMKNISVAGSPARTTTSPA
ncbi:unnamed protein product [Ostreobium quekettii]|uniref:Uncharacterized protein n=1 Tax=Ostreobium quekettii TaxID=121088 RepID=A0A8S1J3K7_9CHLO|nr:unnamed protein product [Ostreobium quekettii]